MGPTTLGPTHRTASALAADRPVSHSGWLAARIQARMGCSREQLRRQGPTGWQVELGAEAEISNESHLFP